jgi:hypothetical protein
MQSGRVDPEGGGSIAYGYDRNSLVAAKTSSSTFAADVSTTAR